MKSIAAGIAIVIGFVSTTASQSAWIARTPGSPGFSSTSEHALSLDEQRGTLVYFNASTERTGLPETWERRAGVWRLQQPSSTPKGPSIAMAYDSTRACTWLVSADPTRPSFETWRWNGSDWSLVTPAQSPLVATTFAFAGDPILGRMVLVRGNETWDWDGTSWQNAQLTTPFTPFRRSLCYDARARHLLLFGSGGALAARTATGWTSLPSGPSLTGAALAFDAGRGVVVLAGRVPAMQNGPDLFEWNGTSWSSSLFRAAEAADRLTLAYDPSTLRTVLAGYGNREWWTDWDGTTLSPALPKLPNSAQGIAYDSARGVMICVGPDGKSHWEWDGDRWSLRRVGVAPPPRVSGGVVYDQGRRRIVVFGGQAGLSGSSPYLNDTWEWDGAQWLLLQPVHSPAPRWFIRMTYDAARGRVVLFGGTGGQPAAAIQYNDTWEWDGIDWTQKNPAASPPPGGMSIVYDPLQRRCIVAGRAGTALTSPFETWDWDGVNWRKLAPPTQPSARWGTFVHDPERGRSIFFSATLNNGVTVDETWKWDGFTWSQLAPKVPFPARYNAAAAYDPRRGRIVAFGGTFQSDLWEYIVDWDEFAPGHQGFPIAITASGAPRLGANFSVGFQLPLGRGYLFLSASPPLVNAQRVDSAWFCSPAFFYPEYATMSVIGFINTQPVLSFVVPNDANLIDKAFTLQGLLLDSGGRCMRATNGLAVRVRNDL